MRTPLAGTPLSRDRAATRGGAVRRTTSPLARRALLGGATVPILVLTLGPVAALPGADTALLSVEVTGLRGLADALANLLLFVPFGMAAALCAPGWRRPVVWAAGVSLFIELVQLIIPGRFTSPVDLAVNTLGAAAGVLLTRRADLWVRPRPALRWLLAGAALAAAVVVPAGGAFLLQPQISTTPLYGQWTPWNLGLAKYRGRVLAAHVGSLAVPPGRSPASEELHRLLLEGATIHVRAVAGPRPRRLAPIFTVYDPSREMVMLGAAGDDAVFRYRTRATAARLHAPDIRVRGGLRDLRRGEPFELSVWAERSGYCMAVNARSWCGLGFTLGDTWGLLVYPLPGFLVPALSLLWIAALMVPAGFWMRSRLAIGSAAVVVVVVLAVVPGFAGILPTPISQFGAALAGLVLGHRAGIRAAAGRDVAGTPVGPAPGRFETAAIP
jgi:hypothetical protein